MIPPLGLRVPFKLNGNCHEFNWLEPFGSYVTLCIRCGRWPALEVIGQLKHEAVVDPDGRLTTKYPVICVCGAKLTIQQGVATMSVEAHS